MQFVLVYWEQNVTNLMTRMVSMEILWNSLEKFYGKLGPVHMNTGQ